MLRFASGMSEEIGRFLLQNGDLGGEEGTLPIYVWEEDILDAMRENELHLCHHVPTVTTVFIYSGAKLQQCDLQSLSKAVHHNKLPLLQSLAIGNTLTGWLKDLFGGPNHPGFPSLEKLWLGDTHLNREDVESLSEAVRAGKLPQLKDLNLEQTTLTGYLKDLFGGPNHHGFLSLEKLNLCATHLNQEDMESLCEAVGAGKLLNLKELDLTYCALNGYSKNLLVGPNHPGFSSLEKLKLYGICLNQQDVKSLSEAVGAEKLPQLKKLDLQYSRITGFMKDLFGGPGHPPFSGLKKINLSNTNLNQTDVKSLGEAVKAGKLPKLKELRLCQNTLTGCLKDLLGGSHHPGFLSLEKLNLHETHLNQEDVKSLGEAVGARKLLNLNELDLSCNTLTGCLKDLFGELDHPGFISLEYLILCRTHLKQKDVESLSQAVRAGKLPNLKHLSLEDITLSGYLKDLFGGPNHPGFSRLEHLCLVQTHLTQDDVEILSEAARVGKLPQLKTLRLWNNTLTGCLKDLFRRPNHPGFPNLEELDLWETHPNQEDVENISVAVRAGKLPQLKELNLCSNNLKLLENEVETLFAALDALQQKLLSQREATKNTVGGTEVGSPTTGAAADHKKQLWLKVAYTGLGWEFLQMCRNKYPNVDATED